MRNVLSVGVAIVAVLLVLSLWPTTEAHLQERLPLVDPRISTVLEGEKEIAVLISLRNLDLPLEDWTIDLRKQNAAARQASVLGSLSENDFRLTHQYEWADALAGYITRSGLDKLAIHPDVVGIGAARLGSFTLAESVPLIEADVVHAAGYDGSGIRVAVLDSGIDTDHPDLSDSIIGEVCYTAFTSCSPPAHLAEDELGHGTRVSGVITSDGKVAPKGVAPGAEIFAYRVGGVAPPEFEAPSAGAVLLALTDIQLRGYIVDFVNISIALSLPLSGTCSDFLPEIASQIAINQFFGNVLTFAGSGNDGDKSRIVHPACAPNVVAVGGAYDRGYGSVPHEDICTDSTTQADKVTCDSNSSSALDLLAPGCQITTTELGGGSGPHCGTSFAAPHAVAVAALLKDAQLGLTAPQIQLRMKATGKWVYDALADRWTTRIDARAALLTDDNGDWDGDGCRNGTEYTFGVAPGEWRNPLDSEDYYDVSVPKDGVIDLPNDILGVIQHSVAGSLPYDVNFDRGALRTGPYFYNHGPRDGVIDLPNDILSVIMQFNPAGC